MQKPSSDAIPLFALDDLFGADYLMLEKKQIETQGLKQDIRQFYVYFFYTYYRKNGLNIFYP